jgi:hypothetical protein
MNWCMADSRALAFKCYVVFLSGHVLSHSLTSVTKGLIVLLEHCEVRMAHT